MKETTKAIVLDMDGTLANLYGVDGWLADLRNENTRPYDVAEPMYNMDELNEVIKKLQSNGWKIIITTWLAKGATKNYNNAVRQSKINWLKKYHFNYDEIHLVKYGTTKADCTRKIKGYQILVDDNEKIRKGWTLGATIDANKNILKELEKIA